MGQKTSNARENARARRKRLRAEGSDGYMSQAHSMISQTLANMRERARKAKLAAFKKVRLESLESITAGGRHGWYKSNVGLVRKPLQGGKIDREYVMREGAKIQPWPTI